MIENFKITLFHNRHSTYKNEQQLLPFFYKQFPELTIVDKKFDLTRFNLNPEINLSHLISCLNKEKVLPKRIRNKLLKALEILPERILVIRNFKDISIDFILEINGEFYFYEYNENQHKLLSDKKPCAVYSIDRKTIIVPKYGQQFIRDIWKIENFKNLKIIWHDWFTVNKEKFALELDSNFFEYFLEDSFSYSTFLYEN